MIILAHRANLSGPHSVEENSLEACADALTHGFGLETDLRRDTDGKFYISHDPGQRSEENNLEAFTKVFKKYPNAELAINVKELGYEPVLVELMNSGALGGRPFYFDFELLEASSPGSAQRKIRQLSGGATVRLGSRLSDRNESLSQCLSIPGEIVWADEFDRLWLTQKDIESVRNAGRKIYVISPELHGFDRETVRKRWADFRSWQVDGICTDYAMEAQEFFG